MALALASIWSNVQAEVGTQCKRSCPPFRCNLPFTCFSKVAWSSDISHIGKPEDSKLGSLKIEDEDGARGVPESD
jgi:hypothetical protein